MDSHDTVSFSRLRDSRLEKLEKKLGLDKLFKKKKPELEPVPEVERERMVFPAPSFLRPTKIRMLARDDISTEGPDSGRRTRSLPETPTTSAQVSSGSESGPNQQMSTGHPTYSPFPRVPQRSSSLAPIRRGPSLAGLLEFSFGNNRASFAGPWSSLMPSPRTRSPSGSNSPSRPITASGVLSTQLDDDLEASVCPLQTELPAALPAPTTALPPTPVARLSILPPTTALPPIPADRLLALPPTAALPPTPADGFLTPPLSAQQDNFGTATLPHDKHLSLAPLSIPTPETSPCLIPQPESALDEPKIEQTISPQSLRGSDSDLATHEAAHDAEDSPKGTSSTSTPKELKKAALRESIYSLSSLLQRETCTSRDLLGHVRVDSASTASEFQTLGKLYFTSLASKGKGKAVLQDLDRENPIALIDNGSENLITFSDSEGDNVIPHDLQGEVPFVATSKAAEDTSKAVVVKDLNLENAISLIDQETDKINYLQGDVLIGSTSQAAEEKNKVDFKDLNPKIHASLRHNDTGNPTSHDIQGDVLIGSTSKAAEEKNKAGPKDLNLRISHSLQEHMPIGSTANEAIEKHKSILEERGLELSSSPGDGEINYEDFHLPRGTQSAVLTALKGEESGKKTMTALKEPSVGDFYTLDDDDLSEDDDSTKAQPPSSVRYFNFPSTPRRARLPDFSNTMNPSAACNRRMILSAPLASQPGIEAAIAAAQLGYRFGFDVIYVVNLWPASIGVSQPVRQASSSSLSTLATVIHRPTGTTAPNRPDYRLTGRLLAGYGLVNVAAPFALAELMHKEVLRSEDWLEYRSPDPTKTDFSRGYMCSFYTGHSPDGGWRPAVPSQEGTNQSRPEINRGIVFAAYRLRRDDGRVLESYRDELRDVRKEAQILVDMIINQSTTLRQ